MEIELATASNIGYSCCVLMVRCTSFSDYASFVSFVSLRCALLLCKLEYNYSIIFGFFTFVCAVKINKNGRVLDV